MAEIVIDAKCPKLPQRPYFHYIIENVSHRSYEATCCIKFAVLEANWVKVNSIVLAFRYPSSLRNKTKKSKECPKLPLFTLRCLISGASLSDGSSLLTRRAPLR